MGMQDFWSGKYFNFVEKKVNDPRPRVVVLVDAVAEAHQSLFAVLHPLEEAGDVVDRADPPQHAEYRLVGAAVQRAVERRDSRCHRR